MDRRKQIILKSYVLRLSAFLHHFYTWLLFSQNCLFVLICSLVQIMHHGPFDDEPATVAIMNQYIQENGYKNDFSNGRLHHEIYMSDARKVAPEKWKTVIRHPICKL